MIQLEYEYTIPFATLKEGKRAAADSLPTAILYRNGVESGLAAPVSTTATTGRYHVTFTTPDDWAKTDRLYLDVQATIDVEVFDEIIWDSFGEPDAVMRGTDGVDATLAKQDEILAAVGGKVTVNILPAVGIVADRSPGATISPVVGETISQSITLYQTDGVTPVDVSAKTLVIVFETLQGLDVAVVASGSITISGLDGNVVTFAYPAAVTASERTLRFAIKDEAAPLTEYLKGLCNVTSGPRVDA